MTDATEYADRILSAIGEYHARAAADLPVSTLRAAVAAVVREAMDDAAEDAVICSDPEFQRRIRQALEKAISTQPSDWRKEIFGDKP